MNNNNIFEQSISSKRLQLTNEDKLTHYFIVIGFIFMSGIGLLFMIRATDKDQFSRSLNMFIISSIIGLLFYYIQYRRLRFTVYETYLNREQIDEVIKYVAAHRKWVQVKKAETYYIATSIEAAFARSWGEKISILFINNTIYFNSICDPDKISAVNWRRNYNHKKLFFKAIKLMEASVLQITTALLYLLAIAKTLHLHIIQSKTLTQLIAP